MTPRLILMRHAKSSWDSPGQSDHARPLNERGRLSATALGGWLRGHGYVPDQVLCSTATRTRETLAGLGLSAPVIYLDQLYHAAPETLLEALQLNASGQTVAVIAHNPGIAEFAERIVAAAPDHTRFFDYPTGSTLVADFDADTWADIGFAQAKAVDFIVPRDLTE